MSREYTLFFLGISLGLIAGISLMWYGFSGLLATTLIRSTPTVSVSAAYVAVVGRVVTTDLGRNTFIADVVDPHTSSTTRRIEVSYSDTDANKSTLETARTGQTIFFSLSRTPGALYTDGVFPTPNRP